MKKRMFGMKVLAALLTTVAMTGCVYDSDEDVAPSPGGGSTLTININSGAVGTTRSTDITNTTTASSDEKIIQNMVIAVFKEDAQDSNTPKLVYYNYLSDMNESAASGFSTTVDNVDADHQFAAGDQVIIVANVPSAVFNEVKAIGTTMSAFKAASLTIAQALDADNNGQVESNCLPMYGSVALTTSGSHLVANVSVGHMVSKITLESLEVNNITSGCSFKPTQVFLYKVADKMDFGFDFSSTYSFSNYISPAGTVCDYTGEVTDPAPTHFAAYLGTKVYTDGDGLETLTNTNTTLSHSCVLYAMPNVFASPDEGKDTRLVIKGLWNDGTSETTCYYNFRLLNVVNGVAQEDLAYRKLYPNRNYRIKVILKRMGATSIDAGVDVNANTAVTFSSVSAWGDGEQTTTFGGTGGIS